MVKKIILVTGIILAFLASAFFSYRILSQNKHQSDENQTANVLQTVEEEIVPTSTDKLVSFLLLGYGGAGHDGGALSDVMMDVIVNLTKKQVTLLSIPRDLWVLIPVRSDEKIGKKINAAYAIGLDDRNYPLKENQYKGKMGGGEMAKNVVGSVTSIKPDYFAAVDFASFKNVIDLLGGVKVDIPKTFDDYFYPVKGLENETCGKTGEEIAKLHQDYSGFELEKQFECRYEHLHFDKGFVEVDGTTALKYVRSRHSSQDGGDFARSMRQKALLMGVSEKLISLSAVKKSPEIYKEFQNLVTTDLTSGLFNEMVALLGSVSEYKVEYVGLTEDNVLTSSKSSDGQFILIPKEGIGAWNGVKKFVAEKVYNN
jgi:polyisoprenyl-teichoic acid--peptidoglycan teichoic acid transferase